MNGAAYADDGALRQRFVVEAVEQHQFYSVPNPEGVTSSHRFAFRAAAAYPNLTPYACGIQVAVVLWPYLLTTEGSFDSPTAAPQVP
jgi:hypothetical protein